MVRRTRRTTRFASAVATVGWLGRIPWAPGTWGSLVGLLIGVLVSRLVSGLPAMPLLVATFMLCATVCTAAERQLGQHDPSSVILDEVWGMAAVILILPSVGSSVALLLPTFLLFRAFDIVKPPPLRRLAELPDGWGIMADDLGAALYTMAIVWLTAQLSAFL